MGRETIISQCFELIHQRQIMEVLIAFCALEGGNPTTYALLRVYVGTWWLEKVMWRET